MAFELEGGEGDTHVVGKNSGFLLYDCGELSLPSQAPLFGRWRIVIHGGVDGFSRIPVYLHASSNNCAATVLNLFTEAVSTLGLPSRVRCDKGGENYDVGFYMLNHPRRGPGRGSIIAGGFYFILQGSDP